MQNPVALMKMHSFYRLSIERQRIGTLNRSLRVQPAITSGMQMLKFFAGVETCCRVSAPAKLFLGIHIK